MKKNKMMRTASGLLVATLLTTSMISGTFAKYTTQDEASDSARVAKWGVTALATGSLFGTDYDSVSATQNGNAITAEVSTNVSSQYTGSDNKNLVAPGTKSDKGMTFKISGTPEVENNVTVEKKDTFQDIYLKGNATYATLVKTSDITKDNFDSQGVLFTKSGNTFTYASSYTTDQLYKVKDVVTLTDDYYPVTYTVTKDDNDTNTYSGADTMFTAINTYLKGNNKANVKIDKSVTITWEWKYDNGKDGEDTILGNLAANANDQTVVKYDANAHTATALEAGTDYNLNTAFGVKVIVTQVD